MHDYILNRLRADAGYVLARGENEAALQHQGIKGRFRELLIDNMLVPWLPPYVSCGTGMIIAANDVVRQFTQDDIIVFDRSLTPAVLAGSGHASEGVFLFNSVLARIEVKSTLTRDDIRAFVRSALEIHEMRISIQPGFDAQIDAAYNLLFAYASDAEGKSDPDYQIRRVVEVMDAEKCDPVSGKVSMVCIPPYGFWKIGLVAEKKQWMRLTQSAPADRLAWFVATISSTCYRSHAIRQGRDPNKGLESGIGTYIPAPYEPVPGL